MMGHRMVTQLTKDRACATIKFVAQAALDDKTALAYSDLTKLIGMKTQPGRGLGEILDEAALMCADQNLPNVSALIVTRGSLDAGKPMPSDKSFVDGIWAKTGMSKSEVRAEQERVRAFDWRKVKTLGLER